MSDTNRVGLRFFRSSQRTAPIPGGPFNLNQLRFTGTPNLAFAPNTIVSNEIRPDRQITDLILVGAEAGGDTGIELSFEPALLRDVHLIVTGSKPHDGEPLPALRLELLRHGKVTYTEELKAIRHLCDWWAPLDEHIWAGGGFKFVDPKRVRFALKPANMYGLTEVLALPLDWAVPADGMRLTSLGAVRLELFAATLEVQTAGDYLKP